MLLSMLPVSYYPCSTKWALDFCERESRSPLLMPECLLHTLVQVWDQPRPAGSRLGGVSGAHCADPYHRLWHQSGNYCNHGGYKLDDLDNHASIVNLEMLHGVSIFLIVSFAQ